MDQSVLDDIITRLLEVRGRPGKQVQLSESEIRQLCVASREIFLQQPNLLELEAPIKICGIHISLLLLNPMFSRLKWIIVLNFCLIWLNPHTFFYLIFFLLQSLLEYCFGNLSCEWIWLLNLEFCPNVLGIGRLCLMVFYGLSLHLIMLSMVVFCFDMNDGFVCFHLILWAGPVCLCCRFGQHGGVIFATVWLLHSVCGITLAIILC